MLHLKNKREREKELVGEMIALYCHKNHCTKAGLCDQCSELANYAKEQCDKCPLMETKTFCSNCKIHCYNPEMREKICIVMRFAGPRMIWYHPIIAIRYLIDKNIEKHKIKD